MTLSQFSRTALMAGVCLSVLPAAPSRAQDSQAPVPPATPSAESDADNTNGQGGAIGSIVVEGRRLRGQLDVDQAPILELTEADIAAEGVTSIADLITQITEQSGSSRGRGGGRPIILINGIRVGSFREFSNYPPEALEKVEVFPEEVAQRFGFAPDRRVINLILKDNYRNAEAELEFEGPANGGYYRREQELGFLQIANGARINVNLEANDTSFLTEDERDIIQTPGSISDIAGDPGQAGFRSPVADSRSLEGNVSYAKAIIDSGISLSLNANYARNDTRRLQGLNTVTLTDAAGNSALRTFGAETPLEQITAQDVFQTSGSVTKPINAFRLTTTFDAGLTETTQLIGARFDTSDLRADALAGTLALDGGLPSFADAGFDTAFTRTTSASTLSTLRGPLMQLPGGEVLATFDVGYDWTRLESNDTRGGLPVELTRGDLTTGANFVVPITSSRNGFADALGSFTLNAQIGVQRLSDFGTLGDYTLGMNWKPADNLDLSATYIYREVAPDLIALGGPQIQTLNFPAFDFVNGETVLVTVISGGNPDLLAETQRDWKFAANWELPFWSGARFTAEYIRNNSSDVTRSFPSITSEIEAAFPDRITRDPAGTLTAVDTRFVTFAEARAERVNFGLTFRGSIGGGERGGDRGGGAGRGGAQAAPAGGGDNADGAARSRPGGPPSAEQRAAFAEFRTRICADDGLDVLMRLVQAAQNGEDLSAIVPGFDARRFERMLSRVRDDNGDIDPERLAELRTRICSFDPAAENGERGERGVRGERGGRGDGGERGEGRREGFAAFRTIACGEDGAARIKAIIARVDAGEDVSDEIPGFAPEMAQRMLGRLRDDDGNVSDERIAAMRERFCSDEAGAQAGSAPGAQSGGPPAGFNPLARRDFQGFRYFVSLNHSVELSNEIVIAPGLAPLDQLDGQATSPFGFPRQNTRLQAGIFGGGAGMRLSARYIGETRLSGSDVTGSGDIFFGDLATFDLRLFGEVGKLVGRDEGALKNLRISFRMDNVLGARRKVTDENGLTPITYQPLLIDPVGRYVGVDIRKLF